MAELLIGYQFTEQSCRRFHVSATRPAGNDITDLEYSPGRRSKPESSCSLAWQEATHHQKDYLQ
jgi:hypothetical protein